MPASRLPVLLPLVAAALSACSIDVSAERHVATEQKTFQVTGKPEVSLVTFDGAIEVASWDRPEVAVTIERYAGSQAEAEALTVTAEQSGNRITIEAPRPEPTIRVGFGQGRGVKFIVSLPAEADLTARTGDGAISAERVRGTVHLRTGDGAIRGGDLAGDVTVSSGDGSITLDRVAGRLDVRTGDGSVQIAGAPSALKARSGDGSISVAVADGATLEDDWDIVTGDGSVNVALPDSVNAEIEARTGDGRVSAEAFSLQVSESRRELTGRIGTGGRRLTIRTGDGSVSISKR